MASEERNWFDRGGGDYARYRPTYPPELARFLSEAAPDTDLALDVGCGNGQLACQLAEHFQSVVGSDASADQIANAMPHPRVHYAVAPAETLGAPDHSASLITAAQAAHWFDLPRFYAEVRRVSRPNGIIALISYGVLELESPLNDRFRTFYDDEIGPYWPPERRMVDNGYADIPFPFPSLPVPRLTIAYDWPLDALLGYISTWSAVRRAQEKGQAALVTRFADDIARSWGDPETTRRVRWPVTIRLGRVA